MWGPLPANRKKTDFGRSRAIFSAIVVAALSLVPIIIIPDFTRCGDSAYYEPAFDHLAYARFIDGYSQFKNETGSGEFLSYAIFYGAAQLTNYTTFVILANIVFSVLLYLVYRSFGRSLLDYILTVPINFYFLVLCFSAQRLKIGVCLMLISVISVNRFVKAGAAVLGAIGHFQLGISVVAAGLSNALEKASTAVVVRTIISLSVFAYVMLRIPAVQAKLLVYSTEHVPIRLFAFAVAVVLSAVYSKLSKPVLIELGVYACAIAVIGESRINILVFWVAWRILFLNRRAPLVVSVAICGYLAYKSYVYLNDLRSGGTGFLDT